MGKSAFASSVITKLRGAIGNDGRNFNSGTPAVAMAAFAEAITEYLIANTTITVTYSGTITATGDPDPITSDTFRIVGVCAPPVSAVDFGDWISKLQDNIMNGFILAPIGTAGIVFEAVPFISKSMDMPQSRLKAAHNPSDTDPQQKIWEIICQAIIDWIGGGAMGSPVESAATNPSAASAGRARITDITIT